MRSGSPARADNFDRLTAALAQGTSRRRALQLLGATLAAVGVDFVRPRAAPASVTCLVQCGNTTAGVVCADGTTCCPGSQPATNHVPGNALCSVDCSTCNSCCPADTTCVGANTNAPICCPNTQVCGTTCGCPSGQSCVANACCPSTRVCGATCCSGSQVCDKPTNTCLAACPAGRTPCGPACCPAGIACVNLATGRCGCPAGTTPCKSGQCCSAGVACTPGGTCPPGTCVANC
jgi:hypothetical protein